MIADRGSFYGRIVAAVAVGLIGGGAVVWHATKDAGTSPSSVGTSASSVTQGEITWTFADSEHVGRFASGDPWVVGPVTITSISPNAVAGLHGWQVNPPLTGNDPLLANDDVGGQSFDSSGPFYDAAMMPSLPYTASAGDSIVKGVSAPHDTNCDNGSSVCLSHAGVLTVLGSVPAKGGATVFRPPYACDSKPLFTTANLDSAIAALPSLASTPAIDEVLPTLDDALDAVDHTDIGYHVEEVIAFHPKDMLESGIADGETTVYAPGLSGYYTDAVLRTLIREPGDNEEVRRQVVIDAIQHGIDIYGDRACGMHWYAAGGTNFGPRERIVFAAWALDSQTIKEAISGSERNDFAETGSVQPSDREDGQPVWGQNRCDRAGCETPYWSHVKRQDDTNTTWDPYFQIDGGYAPSTSYQQCCTSYALKGDALLVHLIPGLDTIWDDQATLDYAQRWADHGLLTQPDPCAPPSQGGGEDRAVRHCVLDPDLEPGSTFTDFTCMAGRECGRFPTVDGKSMGAGILSRGGDGQNGDWGDTPFSRAMWDEYGPT